MTVVPNRFNIDWPPKPLVLTSLGHLAIAGIGAIVAILIRDWGPFILATSIAAILATRLLERPYRAAAVVVWYAVLLTDGPLSPWIALPIVASALSWAPHAHETNYRFRWPVLLACVVVPAIWSVVGLLRGNHLLFVADHAQHFLLLGLYFPMRWAVAHARHQQMQFWLLPTFLLCSVSIALWLGHETLHLNYAVPSPIFQTAIAFQDPTASYRAFLKGDIFLIPAMALFWLRMSDSKSISFRDAFALVVMVVVAVLTGTRGLWLAIAVAVGWAGYVKRPNMTWVRSLGIVLAVCGVLLVTPAAPYIQQRISGVVGLSHDASTQIRIGEANALLAAFEQYPIVGAGLGATLPNAYIRAPEKPYLYELTFHQMLFQLGILGTLAFLAPLAWGIVRAASLTSRKEQRRGPPSVRLAAVGGASLVGLLVASATNPYLFSSVGAVLIALALSMIDGALDGEYDREPSASALNVSGRADTQSHTTTTQPMRISR